MWNAAEAERQFDGGYYHLAVPLFAGRNTRYSEKANVSGGQSGLGTKNDRFLSFHRSDPAKLPPSGLGAGSTELVNPARQIASYPPSIARFHRGRSSHYWHGYRIA